MQKVLLLLSRLHLLGSRFGLPCRRREGPTSRLDLPRYRRSETGSASTPQNTLSVFGGVGPFAFA